MAATVLPQAVAAQIAPGPVTDELMPGGVLAFVTEWEAAADGRVAMQSVGDDEETPDTAAAAAVAVAPGSAPTPAPAVQRRAGDRARLQIDYNRLLRSIDMLPESVHASLQRSLALGIAPAWISLCRPAKRRPAGEAMSRAVESVPAASPSSLPAIGLPAVPPPPPTERMAALRKRADVQCEWVAASSAPRWAKWG